MILGCGFTGTRLARHLLARGACVWATRRTPRAVEELRDRLGDRLGEGSDIDRATRERLTGRVLDLTDVDTLQDLRDWMPRRAYIVHSAPPCSRSPDIERDIVRVAAERDAVRLVYVSSTGVYPPSDGRWIDERSPVGPASDRGRARLAAENALLDESRSLGVSAVSLRSVGIYGPGRGVHARLHAGTYRIIGAGDTYVNRVHVDDLANAIAAAAAIDVLEHDVYHVADDRPEKSRIYADAVADIMGVERPPSVPTSEVKPWVVSMLRANRRVSNQRMKTELGVTLAYPTWREGLVQVMAEDGIPRCARKK